MAEIMTSAEVLQPIDARALDPVLLDQRLSGGRGTGLLRRGAPGVEAAAVLRSQWPRRARGARLRDPRHPRPASDRKIEKDKLRMPRR